MIIVYQNRTPNYEGPYIRVLGYTSIVHVHYVKAPPGCDDSWCLDRRCVCQVCELSAYRGNDG